VKVKLVCQDPLASSREITLDRFPLQIGRGTTAGLRIDDRWTSRQHCELRDVGGQIVVRDLGSRHGTYVNGQSVAGETLLLPGDELCVGLSHFVAVYDLDRPAPAIVATAVSDVHEASDKLLVCLTL
jgi:pSer/pThr/pTyr-binding forkhead associated (FHA) protein